MDETIVIKKLIAGGKGLGRRPDGMTVMARGALPGEIIALRSVQERKGYQEALEIEILEAAPQRITPACPHYQEGCGGCDMQHAGYAAQLDYKSHILWECLQRANLDLADVHLAPMLPAPEPFGYRHRLRLHLDRAGHLGFFQHNSRHLVPIQACLLSTDLLNHALRVLRESRWGQRWCEQISQIELVQSPGEEEVVLIPHPRLKSSSSADQQIFADLRHLFTGKFYPLPVRRERIGRDQSFSKQILLRQDFLYKRQAYHLHWDASCFFQVNAFHSPHLVALALDLMTLDPVPATVLDLFCGMGTFSVPLGLAGMHVTGLEHNRQSLFFAEKNCRDAGLTQFRFYPGDVGDGLKQLLAERKKFAALLFDPPRQGLGRNVALLSKLDCKRIVAVSCDPATLARDLRDLVQQGFHLRAVHPVDMFPQTHHIESLSLLERN